MFLCVTCLLINCKVEEAYWQFGAKWLLSLHWRRLMQNTETRQSLQEMLWK